MNFNEPVRTAGPIFGPAAWAGDALVTGYSRGKLYRTQLVKTPTGYVAQTQLFACLNMLTVDACVAPDGDLVVACHSGGPDWGSGPTGKGKLYKIDYTDRDHPQPVLAWAGRAARGARRVRPARRSATAARRAGADRSSRPASTSAPATASSRSGPATRSCRRRSCAPRFDVPVRSAQLTPDGRTLVLATDPHAGGGALRAHAARHGPAATDEHRRMARCRSMPAIDLDFDLSGCEATWQPADGGAGLDRLAAAPRPRRLPATSPPAARRTTRCGPR